MATKSSKSDTQRIKKSDTQRIKKSDTQRINKSKTSRSLPKTAKTSGSTDISEIKIRKPISLLAKDGSIEAVQFGTLKESSLIYDKTGIDALFARNTLIIKNAIADIKTIAELDDDVTLYDVKVVANKLVKAFQTLYDNL